MLKSLVEGSFKNPTTGQVEEGVYLNPLRRYVMSGILVPTRELANVKIPAATSITQPTRSPGLPIQGPQDGRTEIYSLTGQQALRVQGVGNVTGNGVTAVLTGTGTKFRTQMQIGDAIVGPGGLSNTVLSISSDTVATMTGAVANVANVTYFIQTPASTKTGLLMVEIFDSAHRRSLMNRDVTVLHVFGDNLKPLFLSESILLELSQSFVLTFFNYDTSAAKSFAPVCEGRKWQYDALKRPEVKQFIDGLRQRKSLVQPYWLTLDDGFVTVAANGTATKFFTLTGDITAFLFNLYQSFFYADGAGTTSPPKVEIFDAKTHRQFQTDPLTAFTSGGNAQNPFPLPTPLIVDPQTQIQVNITNQRASVLTFFMTWHGVAMYTGLNWQGGALTEASIMAESQKMYKAMSIPQIIPASPQS